MAQFPQNFPPIAPKGILSFDWNDVSSGVGYVQYYGNESSEGFFLGDIEFWPDENTGDGYLNFSSSSGSPSQLDTSPFSKSRTVNGKVILSFRANASTTGITETVTLIYVDPSNNETTIGAAHTTDSTSSSLYRTVEWSVTNQQIQVGGKLRVEIYVNTSHPVYTGNSSGGIPFQLNIPFKI